MRNLKKALLGNFDLMIDLLAARTIMRLKFKKHYKQFQSHDRFDSCKYDHEIKIQNKLFKFSKLHLWQVLALIISHLCIKTFDLMIAPAANKSIMRSKLPNNALF